MKRAFISRPGVQLLAAALLWILVFAAFLRFGGGGLTLFYEIPPEATGHSLSFSPEGIVRVAETNLGDLCADAVRDQSGADRMCLRLALP